MELTDSACQELVTNDDLWPNISVFSLSNGNLKVSGVIKKQQVNFLVDTGSALTLISNSVFSKLNIGSVDLEPVPYQIHLADGSDLKIQIQILVKHHISTGEAPIKQAPRRIPIHLRHEVMNYAGNEGQRCY